MGKTKPMSQRAVALGAGVTLDSMINKGFFFKIYYLFILFIYLFLAVSGLSCGTPSLHCGVGFSLVVVVDLLYSSCGAWAPGHMSSAVVAQRLSS